MAGNGGKKGPLLSEINVTPLVDVMLVLLIIFMVTAPMMTRGVDVELPETTAKSLPQEEKHVEVTLDRDAHLYLDGQTLDLDELKQRLHAMKASGLLKQVLLRADRSVPYGKVVMVMASIREVGITNLGLVTSPEEVTPRDIRQKGAAASGLEGAGAK
jgi:biopolymer transport protein TolR